GRVRAQDPARRPRLEALELGRPARLLARLVARDPRGGRRAARGGGAARLPAPPAARALEALPPPLLPPPPPARARAAPLGAPRAFEQRLAARRNLARRSPLPDALVVEVKFAPEDARSARAIVQGLPLRVGRYSKYVVGLVTVAA